MLNDSSQVATSGTYTQSLNNETHKQDDPLYQNAEEEIMVCPQLNIPSVCLVCLCTSLHRLCRIDININITYVRCDACTFLPSFIVQVSKWNNIHVQWSRQARLSLQMIIHPQLALIYPNTDILYMNFNFFFLSNRPDLILF